MHESICGIFRLSTIIVVTYGVLQVYEGHSNSLYEVAWQDPEQIQ